MSNRLDQEREKRLEPKRVKYALEKLTELELEIVYSGEKRIDFMYNGNKIEFYPYSGWHTGKGIKDGRGINNLLKQLNGENK